MTDVTVTVSPSLLLTLVVLAIIFGWLLWEAAHRH